MVASPDAGALERPATVGAAGTLIDLDDVAKRYQIGDVMPDLSISATLSGQTWSTILLLGVLVVALATLPNIRRLQRMDIPATLRVVE